MNDAPVGTVKEILTTIVEGWEKIVVRVKQHGKMEFLSLDDVEDQRLVLKIVKDLIRQAAAQNGIRLKRGRDDGG